MRLVCVLLMSSLLAGCVAKTVNSVEINREGNYNWIKTDPELADIASVMTVNKVRQQDLLHVQVGVRNNKESRQVFQYRFVWLDAGNMTLPSPTSAWQRKFIEGKQTVTLEAVAPDARVSDVRLELLRTDK